MNLDQLPDFVLPLKVIEQGYRVVYEPEAIVKEPSLKTSSDEYKMRVRVSLRALWALFDLKHLLNFRKYKIFSWELLSHKWLRYLSFLFLIVIYFSNLLLWRQNGFFKIFFLLQNLTYILAILAFILERQGRKVEWLYLPFFFTLIHLSSARAFIKLILGQKQAIWEPRKGI
jgi:cellulose synthase/poly-beta-1,6-N-acetylglucosamine synthase-like glycosyltransferase